MKELFERKIVIVLVAIILNMCFGAHKNRLIETILSSTHTICFGLEIKVCTLI